MGSVPSTPVSPNDSSLTASYTVSYGTIAKTSAPQTTYYKFPGVTGSVRLPDHIDLREPGGGCYPYPEVRQQSSLSNCSSMAVTAAFECLQRRQANVSHDNNTSPPQPPYHQPKGNTPGNLLSQNKSDLSWVVPSALYNYYYARHLNRPTQTDKYDSGTTVEAALEAMMMGVADEAHWPYDPTKVNTEPSPEAQRNAQQNAVVQYDRLSPTITNIKLALFHQYPVLYSFAVTKSMDAWFRNRDAQLASGFAIVVDEFSKSDIVNAHTVLVIGYDDTYLRTGALLCRNSWGPKWGLDGHFWVPYPDVEYPDLSLSFMLVRQICAKTPPDRCVSTLDCENLYSSQICDPHWTSGK